MIERYPGVLEFSGASAELGGRGASTERQRSGERGSYKLLAGVMTVETAHTAHMLCKGYTVTENLNARGYDQYLVLSRK